MNDFVDWNCCSVGNGCLTGFPGSHYPRLMGAEGKEGNELQFEKAEPAETSVPNEALLCNVCKLEIGDTYYVINDQIICPRCKDTVESAQQSGSGAGRFIRAGFYGALAATLGALIWYAVYKITDGWQFSLISIVIGILVGVAVRKGSNGRGGWLYQGLAMFLTYFAIAATNLPIIFDAVKAHPPKAAQAQTQTTPGVGEQPERSSVANKMEKGKPAKFGAADLGIGLAALFVLVMISPFLYGFQSILGVVIIGIGLYEAWKINRRKAFHVSGPFQINSSRSNTSIG